MNQPDSNQNAAVALSIEIAIRLGLVFIIAAWCLQILTPFISLIMWGAIISISVYSPYLKLVEKLGGRHKLASVIFVLLGLAVILIPVIGISGSLIESVTNTAQALNSGTVAIPAPSESVQSWPLVGEKVFSIWQQASTDIGNLLAKYPEELSSFGKTLLGIAASAGIGMLQFIISVLIAAAFLSSADTMGAAMKRLANRLTGDQGEQLLNLSTSTVRSVAVGVIGIAFIQAVLAGIGLVLADVPAAGLLVIVVLVLAIAQLPPILVLLPVIFYVFSEQSTTVAVVFMIWSILVSMSDMVLKPLLLGRGVDAPMLVILLGAIGGMIASGIVGLFVGAVVLAMGYKLFQGWVQAGENDQGEHDEPAAAGDAGTP